MPAEELTSQATSSAAQTLLPQSPAMDWEAQHSHDYPHPRSEAMTKGKSRLSREAAGVLRNSTDPLT